MTREQALQHFWGRFGWVAYDATTVRDNTAFPYITYEAVYDSFPTQNVMAVSLWDRSTAWTSVTEKLEEISEYIGLGGVLEHYDGGAFWIKKGQPFAQRLGDESDDSVRRIMLNIEIDYLS